MRAVAVELGRPATAFLRPGVNGGDRALRWYSPAGIELTLCGHGTVAAAHVLAARGEAPRGRLVFEAPRHRLAITLEGSAPSATAWFEPDCPRWQPESGDLSPFLADAGAAGGRRGGVGAARADVGAGPPDPGGDARRAPGCWRPTSAGSDSSRRTAAVRGIVLTARETREPGALTHSRVFVPHFGIPEDFATGLLACGHRRVALGDRRPRRRRRRGAVPGRAGRLPGPAGADRRRGPRHPRPRDPCPRRRAGGHRDDGPALVAVRRAARGRAGS